MQEKFQKNERLRTDALVLRISFYFYLSPFNSIDSYFPLTSIDILRTMNKGEGAIKKVRLIP